MKGRLKGVGVGWVERRVTGGKTRGTRGNKCRCGERVCETERKREGEGGGKKEEREVIGGRGKRGKGGGSCQGVREEEEEVEVISRMEEGGGGGIMSGRGGGHVREVSGPVGLECCHRHRLQLSESSWSW